MDEPLRNSKPYIEIVEGPTSVRAGDRAERDDGWWRAVSVTIWGPPAHPDYQSEIEWVPVGPSPEFPYLAGSLEWRIA